MYFPSSNLNYQGAVHFRSPNPDPEAKFNYYIKTGFESLKSKRMKAMKAREKSGGPFVYPTEEELRAEREEEKPELVFTIYDSNGNIMRKLTSGLRKGYASQSWDLRYLNGRGARVSPGKYTVAIDKKYKGELSHSNLQLKPYQMHLAHRIMLPISVSIKILPI